jgi:hypothetical protein
VPDMEPPLPLPGQRTTYRSSTGCARSKTRSLARGYIPWPLWGRDCRGPQALALVCPSLGPTGPRVNGLKMGDTVRVEFGDIVDWAYADGGKPVGLFVERLLRKV